MKAKEIRAKAERARAKPRATAKRAEAFVGVAFVSLIETLEPFDQDARRRILKAAAVLLGLEVVP